MTAPDAGASGIVETERLRLRPLQDGDAGATARLMTPTVAQWLATWPSAITTDFVARRIVKARELTAAGQLLCFAIERREDGAMIGWVSVFRSPRDTSRGDLGYWLGEPFQRRGYMREAARAALAEAFVRLDLSAIEAGAQIENEPSLRVVRGLGMLPIGTRAVWASARNREELCEYYEITRDAHAAHRAAGV
jgi:RimJ/RimL family protein N-acetyltransferase